jgi:hypothetical protein
MRAEHAAMPGTVLVPDNIDRAATSPGRFPVRLSLIAALVPLVTVALGLVFPPVWLLYAAAPVVGLVLVFTPDANRVAFGLGLLLGWPVAVVVLVVAVAIL